MRIMAPRARAWPPAYRDATEKYSGQVKLSADGLTLENYVAGAPFPRIDPKDQQVALKIVWNFNYSPSTTTTSTSATSTPTLAPFTTTAP